MYVLITVVDSYVHDIKSFKTYVDAITKMMELIKAKYPNESPAYNNLYHNAGWMSEEQIPVHYQVKRVESPI